MELGGEGGEEIGFTEQGEIHGHMDLCKYP
jgi:hypothetical protein